MRLAKIRKEFHELIYEPDSETKDLKESLLSNAITLHHKIRHRVELMKAFPDLEKFNRKGKHKVNVWQVFLNETINRYKSINK